MNRQDRRRRDKTYPMSAAILRRALDSIAEHGHMSRNLARRAIADALKAETRKRGQELLWHWARVGVPTSQRKRLAGAISAVERRLICWCCESGLSYGDCCGEGQDS